MSVTSPTLADVRAEVRMLLGEPSPNYWNDSDLNYSINKGAQDMCSFAQSLEIPLQFLWPGINNTPNAISQEALLPVDVDQILWVGYFSGQFFQLEAFNSDDMVKVANRVSGIPIGFYTHTGAQVESSQGGGNTTGDLFLSNFDPVNTTVKPNVSAANQFIGATPTAATPQTVQYSTVMGLWPIPLQNLDVTIMCTRYHPQLVNDQDLIAVIPRFTDPVVHYTIWKCKLKQQAYDEAEIYHQLYLRGRQEMMEYYVSHKQLKSFPDWGGTMWPSLARGSSSVVFIDQSPSIIGR